MSLKYPKKNDKKLLKYWLVLVKYYIKFLHLLKYCIESILTISTQMIIN